MATWKAGNVIYFTKKLSGNAGTRHSREFAERLCHQIEGFGKYGFPSHMPQALHYCVFISLDQMPFQRHSTVAY